MADITVKSDTSIIQGSVATDTVMVKGPELQKPDEESFMDSGETEVVKKSLSSTSGSFKRRSIRRRSSKRSSKPEAEFGNDIATYEKIRERVLQERAVTNAIDALQERWRMIMFMFDDCVNLNDQRRDRKLRKLCIQRQLELILIVFAFLLICLPISVGFFLINR